MAVLAGLPHDILWDIFLQLEPRDVLAVIQVRGMYIRSQMADSHADLSWPPRDRNRRLRLAPYPHTPAIGYHKKPCAKCRDPTRRGQCT